MSASFDVNRENLPVVLYIAGAPVRVTKEQKNCREGSVFHPFNQKPLTHAPLIKFDTAGVPINSSTVLNFALINEELYRFQGNVISKSVSIWNQSPPYNFAPPPLHLRLYLGQKYRPISTYLYITFHPWNNKQPSGLSF